MSLFDNPVIPKGSLVLITGTTGLIGSHIADQFLHYGYKVRGTTRDVHRNAWMTRLFDSKYGPGLFELVSLPDLTAPDAFDDVVKGTAVVVHAATEMSLDPDADKVAQATVSMTVNALKAAAREPAVKRFVLTSSSTAALVPRPDTSMTVTADRWNDAVVKRAYAPPPYGPDRLYVVYGASKTLGEKAAWDFVRDEKPAFVLNTVLPNMNFGAILDPANQGYPSTAGLLAALFKGKTKPLSYYPPQYFVDVQDVGRLHVAAAIHPDVQSERIFAFAEAVNGDKLLDVLRRLYPDRAFPNNFQSGRDLTEIVPRARAEQLLRDMGHDGWTSLEESMRRNTEGLARGKPGKGQTRL